MTENKTKSKIEGRKLILERVFDAPRELVWKAYSDEDALGKWFGPEGWPLTQNDLDFREGGRWHYCMTGPDGTESWGKTVYKEIKAPERLVYADVFSDAEGNTAEGMPEMEITLEFHELDGKTRVVSITTFSTEEELGKIMEMGVEAGMASTWDKLENYLKSAK